MVKKASELLREFLSEVVDSIKLGIYATCAILGGFIWMSVVTVISVFIPFAVVVLIISGIYKLLT